MRAYPSLSPVTTLIVRDRQSPLPFDPRLPACRASCSTRRRGAIDRVVEQMIDRVLKRPGQELPRQVDGQESRIRVDVLVAGHGSGRGRNDRQPATPLQLVMAI